MFGLITVTTGTPATTVNVAVATCDPVVMVTVRGPITATLSIVIGTEALVGPFTLTVPVVMSAPKLTAVVGPKVVPVPVIVIVSAEPWCAEDGLSVALPVVVVQVTCMFVTFALAVPLPLATTHACVGLEGCVRTVTL
jgi:hypothetical protein